MRGWDGDEDSDAEPEFVEYCGHCGGRGSHLAVCCRPRDTAAPLIIQEVLDGVTVAGARAFWALKDMETKHEALRADVMTVVSDPNLEWDEARTMLMAALNAK